MNTRASLIAAGTLLIGSVAAGSYKGSPQANAATSGTRPAAQASSTTTATATARASASATATAGAKVSASPTGMATPAIVHGRVNLPKPITLVLNSTIVATGLSPQQAFLQANNAQNRLGFLAVPPTYAAKNYTLEFLTVSRAQDMQTPPAIALQYVPKNLTSVPTKFPSYTLYKQAGITNPIINPGGKVQTITIRHPKNGVGVVTGQLVDIKFKRGSETVLIAWNVAHISYQVTSNVSVSKLAISELLKVAASFQ